MHLILLGPAKTTKHIFFWRQWQGYKTHPTSTVQILAHVIFTDILFAKSNYMAKPKTNEVGSTPWQQWDFVVQSLSHVQPFMTPWTVARQASLSFSKSWNLLKLMSVESVMPSNHLILSLLLLLPSIFPNNSLWHQCFQWILNVDFL